MPNYFLRFRKLLAALTTRRGRQALAHGVAASIEHSRSFGGMQYRTIVDIGANKGQFALFAREHFPEATVISFEPLASAAAVYAAIFHNDPLTQLNNVGIGAEESWVELLVTKENDASSILQPSKARKEIFNTIVATSERIHLVPLTDSVSADELKRPALLKMDVQGFELSVLESCGQLLPLFDDIYLEASFIELYDKQPLASDLIGWLLQNGYSLRGVFNLQIDKTRGPVEADLLFRKRELVAHRDAAL